VDGALVDAGLLWPLFKLLLINEESGVELKKFCFFPPPTKDSGATFYLITNVYGIEGTP
jgi:hypothetical protein